MPPRLDTRKRACDLIRTLQMLGVTIPRDMLEAVNVSIQAELMSAMRADRQRAIARRRVQDGD